MILASGDLWAGAEVMVYQLAKGLTGMSDLTLLVVLLNKGRLAEELKKLDIDMQVVEEAGASFVTLSSTVRLIAARFSPDIIHSHRYKENLLAWMSAFGKKRISLIATQHGMPETVADKISLSSRLRNALSFRILSHCFDRTVLVSEEMRLLLMESHGFLENNVTVIHNGISIPDFVTQDKGTRLVIGSAGRLFPIKDFTLFVEIASMVTELGGVVDFVIAGDGPQRTMLEEKVNSYGLQECFTFLGHQEEMDAFYRSLDIYINTSVHEGIPMSVLEAMSYGLPVIVADVGGFPEIVQNGEQGFLIGGRQKEVYVERILQLLVESDLRLRMSSLARQRVIDCFSREAMAQAYFDVYSQIGQDLRD